MKFSYNWLREMVDGLEDGPKELAASDHAEDGGVRRSGGSRRGAGVGFGGAGGFGRFRWMAATIAKPWSRPRATAGRRWSAARRIARLAFARCTCRSETKTIDGVESDGMLASAAELGISRDHAGIVELNAPFYAQAGSHHRSRQQIAYASAGFVGPLRHGSRSRGDSSAGSCAIRFKRDLPRRDGAIRVTVERLRSVPALLRAGFRERHRPAVAAVAAISAGSDRAESRSTTSSTSPIS